VTATEARYYRASRAARRAWDNSQPQYVIPGLDEALYTPSAGAEGLVEPAGWADSEGCGNCTPKAHGTARPRSPVSVPSLSAEPPRLTQGAEPCRDSGTDGHRSVAAPSALSPADGSAPLTNDGPGRMSSRDTRGRGHWRTV